MTKNFHRSPVRALFLALGVALAYFISARLGLALAFVEQKVTLVWPPTGVALASLLIFGYRALPGLVLGAFMANISTGSPLLFCLATAVGNPLEAVVGVWLLRRLPDYDMALNRVRDVVALVIVGVFLGPPFSATLGVAGLCASGALPWSSIGHVWPGWCLGDGMGVLLFAPALVTWAGDEARQWRRGRWLEFFGLLALLAGAAFVVFFTSLAREVNYLPLPYFLLPLLLWATIRFGPWGAGITVALTSSIAVASTAWGFGPFAGVSMQLNIAALLAFMCLMALVCLILGALLAERRKSERMLQVANDRVRALNSDLEQRVQARTRELNAANTQIREINALQNAILNTANYAVISATPEGVITSFNHAAERWLGYAAAEVVGRETFALWHEAGDMIARARKLSQELGRPVKPDFESLVARAGLEAVDEFESTFVDKQGRRFPVFLSISALRDHAGNISGYMGVVADITERKQAEEKLRESEERFRLIVELILDYAIYMLDVGGCVASWNAGAERIMGYKSGEIIGRHFSVFYPQKSVEAGKPERLLMEALAHGQTHDEGWRVRKDGSWFYANVVITVLRDAAGNHRGFVKVSRDITESMRAGEKLRESEERFRRSFEDAPIGMALVSLKGRWQRVNRAICDMVGYTEKELLAMDFQTITHPDDLQADLDQLKQLIAGEIKDYQLEKRYFHRCGHVVNVLLSVSLVRDPEGKPLYFVSQIQDITERKKAEMKLAEQTEQLKRSNRELEQFAYVASHDMREPLRAISGFSHILKERYRGRLDDDADHLMGHIIDGAKRMANLIDDLLTLARLDSRGKPLVVSDLEKSLQQAERNLMVTIEERRAVIRHEVLPALPADASQMTLVFQNLIGNAIKFCREQTPEVQIGAGRDGDGFWKISVRDNGIGIAPEHFERIFGVFQRLHTRDEYPGTGIGLAICKKIVELHGGTIWLESEPGKGTTFYFTLPETHQK